MAESSQSTNLDWSVHPHAIPPEDGDDSEAMKVARPVEVTLKVAFLSNPVQDFDDRTSAATLSYGIEYEWLDPRLAGWVPKDVPEDCWRPEFHSFNPELPSDAESGYMSRSGSLGFRDRATGHLVLMFQVRETSLCKPTHDIRNFPFDHHIVTLKISCAQTVAGCDDYVRFKSLADAGGDGFAGIERSQPGFLQVRKLELQDEWETFGVCWGLAQHASAVAKYHDAVVAIQRRRVPRYYLHKALYPTLTCALLSTAALVVPAEDISDRFSILLTLFLSVYAIQWVTSERYAVALPPAGLPSSH